MDMQEKLEFFHQLVMSSSSLNCWVRDPELNCLSSNCSNEQLLDVIFTLSGCRDYLQEYIKTSLEPLILNDSMGMMWAAVFEKEAEVLTRVHLIGPSFTTDMTVASIKKKLNEMTLSIPMKTAFMNQLEGIPVLTMTSFYHYILMLQNCISGETIKISDLNYQVHEDTSTKKKKSTSLSNRGGTYAAEQMLMNNIRKGNLNYTSAINRAALVSTGIGILASDSVRRAKDTTIVFSALCTRAAIEGGLSPESAYTLGDYYSQSAEDCNAVTELAALNNIMYDDFIQRVNKLKKNPNISKTIQSCCDYIDSHIEEKISIEYLAKNVGYAEYYLSRKFKSEVGCSINEYIKNAKIEHAKMLLISTPLSIQEISDSLGFCSRSFFTNSFQQVTGQKPSEYRSKKKK